MHPLCTNSPLHSKEEGRHEASSGAATVANIFIIRAVRHVPMSKPQRTNLDAWANYTTEQAKDFLLSLPEELWGDVIDRISHNVSWYRNNDIIVVNLALLGEIL